MIKCLYYVFVGAEKKIRTFVLPKNFVIARQRASRAKTRGLRGGQLNAVRSSAAGRKILDRAVKSVM